MKTAIASTAFEYLYRDAANYKAFGTIVLRGSHTDEDSQAIMNACESELYFVAEQVGVAPLYADLYQYSGGPTEDDHVFHEFIGLRAATPADGEPTNAALAELVSSFRATGGCWDYTRSAHWNLDLWR